MRKHVYSGLLALLTVLTLTCPALAVEEPSIAEVTVNGEAVSYSAEIYDGTAYIPFYNGVQTLRPDAEITWADGVFTACAEDFTMTASIGDYYIVVNNRYLYVPKGVKGWDDGTALVPARVLATALGAWIGWSDKVELCSGGEPLAEEGRPYDDETLDILARVIMHESGYQPFLGKLAVGSVIVNRVNSSRFPNTVGEVIYAPNQFPGATNANPNADSILAARLCLEGANVVPGAYYFNGVGKSCWASRNKKLLYTIGGHSFYG